MMLHTILCTVVSVLMLASNYSGQAQSVDLLVHDPVVIQQDSMYYLFCTGNGITNYSSKDLKSWTKEAPVFNKKPKWADNVVSEFKNHIWAPDISFHNETYYLYYSISSFGKNTSAIGLLQMGRSRYCNTICPQ